MAIWYFETSALNWLADKLTEQDAIETKAIQSELGQKWVISPVCMWEIFLTKDEARRKKLIVISQLLFSNMLPSPEEMLIHYINEGFPEREKQIILSGNCDISNNNDKPIIVEGNNDFKAKVKELQKFNKVIDNILRDGNTSVLKNDFESAIKEIIETSCDELVLNKDTTNPEHIKIIKVTIFYIIMILCVSGGVNNKVIDKFWEQYGLECISERFQYIMNNFRPLINQGPLVLSAMMTISQAKTKRSRGLYFDNLHAMYITYSDLFFTTDDHFVELREMLGKYSVEHQNKIHHINEVFKYYEKNPNDATPTIII